MAESPTMEVRARLSADSAQFVQGMDRAVKSTQNFQQASSALAKSSVAVGVAVGTATAAIIAFGVKAFKVAAEVERFDIALQAVGRTSGLGYEALNASAKGMKSLGIQASVAQRTTLKFVQSNIDLAKATDLARAAQDLSIISGTNAEDALQTLTMAITTGQTRMLRSIGITDSAGGAYERYAAELGKAAKDLTMAERRQAVMNLVMREGSKVAGAYAAAMESPSYMLKNFGSLHNDLMVAMGGVLVKGFGPLIKSSYNFEKNLIALVDEGGKLNPILKAMEKVLLAITTPISNIIDNLGDFVTNIDLSNKSVDGIASQLQRFLPIIAAVSVGFATFAGKSLLQGVPIIGNLFRATNPLIAAFAVLAFTSPQLQKAFINLFKSLSPLLEPLKQIGKAIMGVLSVAVSVLAAAINGLTRVIRGIIGFFKQNEIAAKILAIALGAVTAGLIAYKAQALLSAAASNKARDAKLFLAKAVTVLTSRMFLIVTAVAAVIGAFVYLWQSSESFRENMTRIINEVARVVGAGLAWIIQSIGQLLLAFGTAIAPTTSFGQTLAKVIQFAYVAYVTAVQGIVKVIIMFLKAINYLVSANTGLGKTVRAVLNFIFKAFAVVVGGILKFIGFFLEALGMLLDTHGLVGNIIGMILDFLWKSFATVIGGIIKYIGMFIEFLGNLLDTNAMVGKLIAGVLDFLIDAFATVFGGIFKYIGIFISFLGDLLDANSFIGKGIAKVINFIASIYFTLVEKVSGFLAKLVGALYNFLDGNRNALEIGIDLFNNYAEGVGKAITFIPQLLAQSLQKFGSFVKSLAVTVNEFLGGIADKLASNKFTAPFADSVRSLGTGILAIGNKAEQVANTVAKPIMAVVNTVRNFTKQVISDSAFDTLLSKVGKVRDSLVAVSKSASGLSEKQFGTDLVNFISSGLSKIGSVSQKIGNTILEVTKVPIAESLVQSISDALTKVGGFTKKIGETVIEAGDIKLGTELVQMLSDASKFIGGAVSKVGAFVYELKQFEVGDILGDIVEGVTDFGIEKLTQLVNVLENIKDLPVGQFLVENLSEKSIQAGEKLLSFAEAVRSFTEKDFVGKLTEAFGNLADKLKTGLGFGDILEEETDLMNKLESLFKGTDDGVAEGIQGQADLMAKIRDAMKSGIESMRDVLADLQDAAKQFADSLKDTILSFAGLKAIELPDGFIPKAKSLIENMRMRLEKSQTFANQILTLQGLGLSAKNIQDLIEAGPIQGSQLAASILSGGAEAISQINELQTAIGFAGTAIGEFGKQAAFGEKIQSATQRLASVTDAELGVRGLGGKNIVIEQGAFVVNVSTAGLATDEERVDMITTRIQETFAILAKELANK
jgi:hypothetical protein